MANKAVHGLSVIIDGRALACLVPDARSVGIGEQSMRQILSVLCGRVVWYTEDTSDYIRDLGAAHDWPIDTSFKLRDWIPQLGLLPFKTSQRREDYERYKARAMDKTLDTGARIIPTIYEAGQIAAALAYDLPLVTADRKLAEFAQQQMQVQVIWIPCS